MFLKPSPDFRNRRGVAESKLDGWEGLDREFVGLNRCGDVGGEVWDVAIAW